MVADRAGGILSQPLFARVPQADLAPLLAASRVVRFVAGEEVFAEGDDADGVYLIASGSVRIMARSNDGQVLLSTLVAPGLLGEMGVLDGQPRSGTATAVETSTAYFIPAGAFLDLLEKSSLVTMRLLALVTERLRKTNGRLLELPAPPLFADDPGPPDVDSVRREE